VNSRLIVRQTAFLMLLPALTLIVSVGLARLAAGHNWAPRPNLFFSLVAAIAGPILALLITSAVRPGFDWILVATASMLTAIGTATLLSLSLMQGAEGEFYQGIVVRHTVFVGTGFLALIIGAACSCRLEELRRYPITLLAIAIGLTATTVISGQTVNGARLWLRFGPFQFQPSEVARLLIAAFVAVYLYDHRHLVIAPWRFGSVDLPPVPYLLPLAGAVLAAVAVLALQNDLGMAALVVLGALASSATVLNSRKSLSSAGAVLMLAAIAANGAAPRVRDRVAAWLEPWQDPIGRGFQFVQADYGLSAGGLFGVRNPALAARVPEVHTDFILVGIATQWGLIGAMAVLALLSVLVCRCMVAALNAADGFLCLLALAIGTLIGIQVLLILAGTLRLLPLTGLTVPLVSFGGTSMIVTLFAIGLVAGIGTSSARRG
jgi:cell division protein FtsW (lipid II flippase)